VNLLLVLPVLVPLATAVAGILLLRAPRVARWASVLGSAGLLASSVALLSATLDGTILVTQAGAWSAPFGITLAADRFAAAMVVVGAVLIAGAAAPRLVTRDMVRRMKPGSVLVDISIDQGGCFETSRATTHAEPTYVVDDVIHYCVANMPGAVPRTSTFALNNATLPFARRLADHGWKAAMQADPHLANGLNVHAGHVTNAAVAQALDLPYTPVAKFLK